jgi:hypothetical protein
MTDDERLVQDYLRQLRRAAAGMPRARRRELLGEISAHIAEAQAAANAPPVPVILERIGDPEDIAREAGSPAPADRLGGLEIAAVTLLLVGGFLAGIGWIVGVVMLWASPHWRWPDKVLGTLVWPGGLLAPVLVALLAAGGGSSGCLEGAPGPANTCTTAGPPGWEVGLRVAALVIAFVAPMVVAARLVRRARQLPSPATPGEALAPVSS